MHYHLTPTYLFAFSIDLNMSSIKANIKSRQNPNRAQLDSTRLCDTPIRCVTLTHFPSKSNSGHCVYDEKPFQSVLLLNQCDDSQYHTKISETQTLLLFMALTKPCAREALTNFDAVLTIA